MSQNSRNHFLSHPTPDRRQFTITLIIDGFPANTISVEASSTSELLHGIQLEFGPTASLEFSDSVSSRGSSWAPIDACNFQKIPESVQIRAVCVPPDRVMHMAPGERSSSKQILASRFPETDSGLIQEALDSRQNDVEAATLVLIQVGCLRQDGKESGRWRALGPGSSIPVHDILRDFYHSGNLPALKDALKDSPAGEFNTLDPQTQRSVLYLACRSPNTSLDVVKFFIQKGCNANLPNGQPFGSMPQHGVVKSLKEAISKSTSSQDLEHFAERLLLILMELKKNGATMGYRNMYGHTALDELKFFETQMKEKLGDKFLVNITDILQPQLENGPIEIDQKIDGGSQTSNSDGAVREVHSLENPPKMLKPLQSREIRVVHSPEENPLKMLKPLQSQEIRELIIRRESRDKGQGRNPPCSHAESLNLMLGLIPSCISHGFSGKSEQAEPVLFIGNTGSGKSTTVNFLAGAKMMRDDQDHYELKFKQDGFAKIGHSSSTSQTLRAEMIKPDGSSMIFVDCPGFQDSRGFEFDVAHAANINTSLKLGNARLVIVVDVASAKTARASLLKTLFASVRKMFPHTEKLEASCLIAVTKLPFEMSARKNTFDDVSEIIRKAWDQGDEDLLGKKSQSKPHPYPKIVQIELLGEPKPVLRVLNTLTTIEGASAHFVPNLPAAVELALNLVLNHVRDQVGQCLEKEYFSDVFSLISLLDKFASFKLKQALIVKNEAVQRIVDFELGLKTDILRLSRASESSKERKEGLYVELFRRFESLCQKFDDLCGQKLSPIWSSFRTEIESIDSRTQRGELDKVKRNSETCLSTLSALLQSETNDIPLKKLISLNCKRIFEDSSNRPESLDNFLKNLIHPSVTSSIQPVLKDAAKDLRSVMLEFAGRHRCCETYVFPRDVDARHEYSELCCFACDQLWSIGKNISLALREAELEKIAVKVLGKMDEILEKSNDPDLCRQIGQNITSQKSMLECGLTSSEMEILREFDEVVLKSAQQPPRNLLNFQPGKKPNAPQVAPGVHVVHPASVKSQVVPRHSASLSPPPVSRPSIAVKPINFPQNSRIPACVPSQDAKLQPQPHVPSAPAAFEDFKQRLDVESCKKCLRWVTRLKEKMFQHCKAISEWLKSLEMLKFHQNAEYSTILSELRQAIPALYDETTVRGWIEKQEFSLLSNTFVEVQSLRAAVQPYNINIKVDEFEHQVSGGITRLFETARGDITSYCSSEEFEGKIRILSMKTLLACNKAFQNTALQVQIQSLVDSFCKLVKKMVEDTCKIRLGGHGLCMRILKLMYLNENLLGVNIPGDFVKNECKKMIELQAQEVVLEAGTEIFANSCDELQDTATKTMQTFPQFRSQSVKWFNSKAGTKDFPAVLKEMRVQILGSAPSKLSSQAQDIMQTCYGIADGIFADQMRSAIDLAQISSTNSQQQPLPQQSTSRNIQPVLDAIRAAVGRHTAAIKGSPGFSGNILGKDVQFHHCIHDVSGLLGNLFAAYSILEGASMFESDRATWLQPHPTQIACILMLLGIGTDNHIVKNQLAEVGTGEGKSIILGMLGLFFALLGKKVDILCYNPYLSERDEKAFQKVFKFFKYIPEFSAPNHCPINKLYEHFVDIHVLPNLRECVQQVAADLRYAHCAGFEQADRVLLIDEVDVFFGEHFFGQVHTTGHVFDDADSRGLVSFVFDNRDKHHSRTIDASIDVLKKNPFFRNLQKKYPKLDLKRHLEQMLRDLNLEDFPVLPGLPLGEGQKLVRVLKKENDIGYLNSATSSIDRNTSYRYKTTFAYLFKCRVSKEIDEKIGKRPYGIILTSGYQLYSELPKYCRLLLGISGTVSKLSVGDHDILKEFNFSTTTLVPSTFRKEHVVQAVSEKGFDINFQSKDAFHSQIVARVQDVRSQQSFHRPILIVLKDESEVKIFARKFQSTLRQLTAPLQLTEAVPFDERDRIISLASSEGAITLVARSYGRGSDFVSFSRAVNDKGGVHVILTFLPELVSEMVQIKGRTGRQDNKGSFEELYWKDDLVTDADGNTRYVSAVELDAFWSGHPDNTERHKFLCDKRDEHDRNRTQRMKAKLESNRGRATRTTEMVGFAAQNRTQQAIDIAYEFSFATVTSVTHTVFIIDESGSMKDRWSSLQKSFSAYLRILIAKGSSSDVVSVIQFDTDARLVDHATKISPQQASQLSLNMRGNGTNFGPAIALANDFLEQDSYPSDIVLVFMTDGENTDGDVALGALQNLFKNRSARNPKFNAIGFIQQPASLIQMVAAVSPDGFLYAANDAVQLEQRFVEVAEAMCMGERKVGDASKQKH